MLRKIMIPIDGSDNARRALTMASTLAAKFDAELLVVHSLLRGHVPDHVRALAKTPVPEQPSLSVGGAYVPPSLPHDTLEEIATALLEEARQSAESAGVRTVRTSSRPEDATRAILSEAERFEPDLIIMGSRGLGDLKGLLLGSVSQKVQQLFPGNVLLVK